MMTFDSGHAVVVGVGADLAITVDDATAVASLLKDQTRCAYPKDQVMLLTEQQATRTQVLDALDALAKVTDQDSTAIIYFSGHGSRVELPDQTTNFYLVTHGYDEGNLSGTCINGQEFTEKLRAIQCKKLLVLLDCCHAGGLSQPKTIGTKLTKSPLPLQVEDVLSQGSGRVILASSRADEKSWTSTPYSEFTLALLEALSGAGASDKDGFARVLDVALYIGRHVPNRTKEKQHPIIKVSNLGGDFAIAYYASGTKDPLPMPPEWGKREPMVLANINAGLADGYRDLLRKYKSNLLKIEIAISEFIDQRSVPPDFLISREEAIKKIESVEQKILGFI